MPTPLSLGPIRTPGESSSRRDRPYGHESILSFISYRFGLGYLTERHRQALNIGLSFDWERPDFDLPVLSDPPEIVTRSCALGGGDVLDSQQAHSSDLAELEAIARRQRMPCSTASRTSSSGSPTPAGRARGGPVGPGGADRSRRGFRFAL
ncbi:MAG TPA: hypothetical protein VKB17_04755 [Thermoleophilaceae bacterium]|nr:hypothetical protein [Thermoleophilaceae bacterium]